MIHPCDKPCGNKTASGYCATTACINPKYSNIGTAYYGQGVWVDFGRNYPGDKTLLDWLKSPVEEA